MSSTDYKLLVPEDEAGAQLAAEEEDDVVVPLTTASSSGSVLSRTQKWLLVGVVVVALVVAVAVPVALREHKYEDGASVAVVTHEINEVDVREVDYNSHLEEDSFANYMDLDEMQSLLEQADAEEDEQEEQGINGDSNNSNNTTRSRRSLVCQNNWPRDTLLELAGFSDRVYNWQNFRNQPEDVATNHLASFRVRALVFAVGTFQHGWLRDHVRVRPNSARVLTFMGTRFTDVGDWAQNFQMFCSNTPASYMQQARDIVTRARAAMPDARIVMFTGHSLGGALAGVQAAEGRGCAVGFNSPPLSAIARRTSNMIVYRIDTDIVSLPFDRSNPIWQRVSAATDRVGIRCNHQQHLGPVVTLPMPQSFSFGRFTLDVFTRGADALVSTAFSLNSPDWIQFLRDTHRAHAIRTVEMAIRGGNQRSWWCRNIRIGC
ncbi:hypothetical protein PTSG_12659 [Salpingoeca rosetta]|uniref:Uncharacterized protein n=1 Tax=Salpingoeca rosetta (strain ATCC 50818 / BSB-021) TaxID=946362 RepID=F2UGS3_SALR5|nr:uncharacterized protein PTSG_12659 [Salpingoeca rosetta]EGD75823.1 hypothetical protein PTSG_12659 [Salpingoeca rosetta]|eukprot:XP_004991744.1 hypothetical protein PTSG_12659 [Salpingoeca rosetta]